MAASANPNVPCSRISRAARRKAPSAARERDGTAPPAPLIDPFKASLAFSDCMRRQGLPYPRPDRAGNFHLTPRQEQRLLGFSPAKRESAEKTCFHHLRPVVSTKPLSSRAKGLAKQALRQFAGCMRAEGFDFYSDPMVRNLSRGRAFFGFRSTDPTLQKVQRSPRFLRVRTACERKLSARLDKIVASDRGEWIP